MKNIYLLKFSSFPQFSPIRFEIPRSRKRTFSTSLPPSLSLRIFYAVAPRSARSSFDSPGYRLLTHDTACVTLFCYFTRICSHEANLSPPVSSPPYPPEQRSARVLCRCWVIRQQQEHLKGCIPDRFIDSVM